MLNPFDPIKYPYCHKGHNYANDVISGRIPNSIYLIGACKRYIKDLQLEKFPFSADRAEKYLRSVQKFNHIKGEWTTKNIVYEPWQCWVFMNIMGFIDTRTNYRRFRTAHLEVPRGSGKSPMASTAGLYFLALDDPKGNEISCFATKSDQAKIVLDTARAMAKANKSFRSTTGVEVRAHSIIQDRTNSSMRSRSSDHGSLDGLNDVLSIIDELHAVDRSLFDVVVSGMKKRRDSLLLCITTAGFNTDGVGYSQSCYAKRISTGDVEDDTFFAAIYTIDEGDDIFEESTWKKANPNYGISVDNFAFEAAAKKAREVPSDLPNFKVKMLNTWLSEARAYFNLAAWDNCADPDLKIENFIGKKGITAIDLSSKIDLTSLGYVFKEGDIYYVFDKSYIPEDTVREVRNALYDESIAAGHLISTKGEAINYEKIREDVVALHRQFKIGEYLYDPWNATSFAQDLGKERLNMVEFRFNTANLSEPTKNLDALIRTGKIRHNGSKLLRWAIGNVVCKEDAASNIFPRKSHEKLKIDPAIAIIMAIASWMQKTQVQSVYEERGIRSI